MADETLGRRERKKAATRKAISNAATELFLERGFDQVSIREVADKADVSPTTVFAHFPQKEALVWDEDDEQRELLIAAVRDRTPGTSIPQALRDYFSAEIVSPGDGFEEQKVREFLAFVDATPALKEYGERMWLRHEHALADAIAAELGAAEPSRAVRAFARYVLQTQVLALTDPEPAAMIAAAFGILESGWSEEGESA